MPAVTANHGQQGQQCQGQGQTVQQQLSPTNSQAPLVSQTQTLGHALNQEPPSQIWNALKKHVIRERQRKKEEHEAEVEEERLRKEKERQDVMTLGETREQIDQLESKLSQLKEEKHLLFLQLKKVLNEDDNRKRQQNKDSNEMLVNMNGMIQAGNIVQSQLFLPPNVPQGNPNLGRPPLSAHLYNKSGGSGMKRGRSPSPPYAPSGPGMPPGSPYMHHPHHKQTHGSPYQGPPPHKMEDNRSREMARAVLWNKPSQYNTGNSGPYYAVPQTERPPPMLYTPLFHPNHVQHHTPSKQISHSPYHLEVKHETKKEPQVVMGIDSHQGSYGNQSSSGPPSSSSGPGQHSSVSTVRHAPQQLLPGQIHPVVVGALQHAKPPNPKAGGITTGYPVRQQNPTVQNPHLYPTRLHY